MIVVYYNQVEGETTRKGKKMNQQVKNYLKEKQEQIKFEFSWVGITPRQFSRFGGDYEYAEWEIIAGMQNSDIWDGFEDYDEITTSPEFVKTARWQAAYNTVA